MLEFTFSMNQKLMYGNEKKARQNKMIELLMMRGAKPSHGLAIQEM